MAKGARRVGWYLLGLVVAAAAVFAVALLAGRRVPLEEIVQRRREPAPFPQGRTLEIPSLHPVAPPPAPEPPPAEEVQDLAEGIKVAREPMAEGGIVLLLDLEALAAPRGESASEPRPMREGLREFLSRVPATVRLGLRALSSGVEGGCADTQELKPCGRWSASELGAALDAGSVSGGRNLGRALVQAAADLEPVPGARVVVAVVGGPEGCASSFCETAASLRQGARPITVHLVMLAPPSAATAEPAWTSDVSCLAQQGGGMIASVSTAGALTEALLAIARGLESSVVVRAFHLADKELTGASPAGEQGWGAALTSAAEGAAEFTAHSFPATLGVPGGSYALRSWYRGQERRVEGLAVAPLQRAEVRVTFATGELFVQAQDDAGNDLLGDTGGFGCPWGAEVFPAGGEEALQRDCSFPAQFELAPGAYRVRVWWKGRSRWVEEVAVEAGEHTMRTVPFAEAEAGEREGQ